MATPTVKLLLQALDDQRASADRRIEQLEQRMAAQIEATKPRAHIGHWLTGIGLAVSAAMLGATLFFNSQAADRQLVAAKQQQIKDQKQDMQLVEQRCVLWDQRALEAIQANPSAAERIFAVITEQSKNCEAVGLPLLASVSFQIGNNPSGIPTPIAAKAARVRVKVSRKVSVFAAWAGDARSSDDRLNYDAGDLRRYYLTQGYTDFRVVSAACELTAEKKDFIIDYDKCGTSTLVGCIL